jgi:hypothetical protein
VLYISGIRQRKLMKKHQRSGFTHQLGLKDCDLTKNKQSFFSSMCSLLTIPANATRAQLRIEGHRLQKVGVHTKVL